MSYNLPHQFCYILPHHQYLNTFVNYRKMNKGDLTKLCLLHRGKGKSLVAFNAKNYFANLAEDSKFTFYC